MAGRFEYYETVVSPFGYQHRECGYAWVEDDADRERLKREMKWRFPIADTAPNTGAKPATEPHDTPDSARHDDKGGSENA